VYANSGELLWGGLTLLRRLGRHLRHCPENVVFGTSTTDIPRTYDPAFHVLLPSLFT
jgi:hypothetical protein